MGVMEPPSRRAGVAATAAVLAAALLSACTATAADPTVPPTPAASSVHAAPTGQASGQPATDAARAALAARARTHMAALADGIGARYSGTDAERRAAQYATSAFEEAGYTVERQDFRFNEGSSANLVATKQGRSDREIVVGAHYDSGDEADGADDNASGVGVLLAAAEAVSGLDVPWTIRFVAFGAEEADDMFGSAHYVDQLDGAEARLIEAMVNIDSVSAGDIPYVYGDARALRDWTVQAAAQAGERMDTRDVRDLHEDADYYAFQRAGIPFIYFEATNWNLGDRDGFTQVDRRYGRRGAIMHTRFDTLDYLDQSFPGRVDARLGLYASVLVRIITEYGF